MMQLIQQLRYIPRSLKQQADRLLSRVECPVMSEQTQPLPIVVQTDRVLSRQNCVRQLRSCQHHQAAEALSVRRSVCRVVYTPLGRDLAATTGICWQYLLGENASMNCHAHMSHHIDRTCLSSDRPPTSWMQCEWLSIWIVAVTDPACLSCTYEVSCRTAALHR